MPASLSAAPAGCILGLSFFEPMMIPTCGSATSISSKASSTAGIAALWVGGGLGADPSVGIGSSEISLTLVLSLSGHALSGAGGDVGADLHSIEGDPARRTVSACAGGGRRRPEAGHVEDPAAGGDDLLAAARGARMGDLGDLRCLLEAADRIALGGRAGIARRSEDEGHGPVVVELGADS